MKPFIQRLLMWWTTGILFSVMAIAGHTQTPAEKPRVITPGDVVKFINDAGYAVCEEQEMTPSQAVPGTLASAWAAVAKDCRHYDPNKATTINAHQYKDKESRDAAIAQFRSLHFRAVRGFGTIWPVGDTAALAVFGHDNGTVSKALQVEWERRHPKTP